MQSSIKRYIKGFLSEFVDFVRTGRRALSSGSSPVKPAPAMENWIYVLVIFLCTLVASPKGKPA